MFQKASIRVTEGLVAFRSLHDWKRAAKVSYDRYL